MTDDLSPEDLALLQHLRLARRNCNKREKQYYHASKRLTKARRKLYKRIAEVEARGLDTLDPRSLD